MSPQQHCVVCFKWNNCLCMSGQTTHLPTRWWRRWCVFILHVAVVARKMRPRWWWMVCRKSRSCLCMNWQNNDTFADHVIMMLMCSYCMWLWLLGRWGRGRVGWFAASGETASVWANRWHIRRPCCHWPALCRLLRTMVQPLQAPRAHLERTCWPFLHWSNHYHREGLF